MLWALAEVTLIANNGLTSCKGQSILRSNQGRNLLPARVVLDGVRMQNMKRYEARGRK